MKKYVAFFVFLGCRDKNFIPDPEPSDSGIEAINEPENPENAGDDHSDNGDTPSNDGESQSNTPDDRPEESEQNDTVLNPDFIIYTFSHGYTNGAVSEVIVDHETRNGIFSAILYDTNVEEYCSINWTFDSSSVVDDDAMNSGSVEDIHGLQSTTWFGFIITSNPQTSGNCNLNENGQYYKDILLHDEPGFGYGPLTDNLQSYLQDGHYENWNDMEEYVFSGIVSSLIFDHGNRIYLDINVAYAYPIEDGTTTWLPSHDGLQGNEILHSELPKDGFYFSRYFFAIPLH